jgi:hypothetical protein
MITNLRFGLAGRDALLEVNAELELVLFLRFRIFSLKQARNTL